MENVTRGLQRDATLSWRGSAATARLAAYVEVQCFQLVRYGVPYGQTEYGGATYWSPASTAGGDVTAHVLGLAQPRSVVLAAGTLEGPPSYY